MGYTICADSTASLPRSTIFPPRTTDWLWWPWVYSICPIGVWTSRSATIFWRFKNIKPTSEAIGGFLISFRLYKAESSLAVYNIMSGLFLKAPELVLRNLLYLSEKCKQICLAADTYEVQIVLRFRLFPSLPTVLRHSERNSSFDKSQWQPPRRVLPNFSKLFSFVKDMQKSVPSDTLLRSRMIAALEKQHTSPKTHKTKETWLPVCSRKRNKSKR